MSANPSLDHWRRVLLMMGTTILIVAALYWTRSILVPVVLAAFFTFILAPLVNLLQRRGLGRILAVLLVVTATFSILGALLGGVLLQTKSLAQALPQHTHQIAQKIIHLREAVPGSWLDEVETAFQEIREKIKEMEPAVNEAPTSEPIAVTVTPSRWSLFLSAGSAVDILVSTGLVAILVIFMLIRREDLRNRLIRLLGDGSLTRLTKAMDDAASCISRYLFMQFIVNGSYGLLLGVGFAILGVPYSVLWGFLAAILRYLPYVGAWIGAIFPIATSAAVMPSWTTPLLVIGFIVIVELVVSNLVEPVLYGHSLGISEVALLISVAFWTWLWGPVGLVLATPLTACLLVSGRFVPALHGFTILLGDEPALDPGAGYYQRLLAKDQDEAVAVVEEQMKDRPPEEILDQVFLAALARTKQNEVQGNLTEIDAAFIYRVTTEFLDDFESAREFARATQENQDDWLAAGSRGVIFSWVPEHKADQLALRMLSYLLEPEGIHLKILAPGVSMESLMLSIEEEEPAGICLANVPPAALAPLRNRCQRLRARFHDLKIVIGVWGRQENLEKIEEKLMAAGADHVGTSLAQVHEQVRQFVPVAPVALGHASRA